MTKQPNRKYRDQLLDGLARDGWQHLETMNESDWWGAEHWVLKSIRQNFGLRIILTFLVDPLAEAVVDKNKHVWCVRAASRVPKDSLDEEGVIADLEMRKGHFGEKLAVFTASLDEYRRRSMVP